MRALIDMRKNAKEKELEALLSEDNDSCSCFIEVAVLEFPFLLKKRIIFFFNYEFCLMDTSKFSNPCLNNS